MFGLMSSSNRRPMRFDRAQEKTVFSKCLIKSVLSWPQIGLLSLLFLVFYYFYASYFFTYTNFQKSLRDSSKVKSAGTVENIAFSTLLKITVPEKTQIEHPRVRSFGSYSETDNLTIDASKLALGDRYRVPTKIRINHSRDGLVQQTILSLWELSAREGSLNYDITSYPRKFIPGVIKFVALLNEGRVKKKRKSEFRMDKVIQSFDTKKFNFEKAVMKEVLFEFELTENKGPPRIEMEAIVSSSPNLVMLNVNPIETGHILLVPRVLDKLPQQIIPNAMFLALRFASAVGNSYFRLNYNSFGAFASVNHLHFQGYFLMAPYPIERAPARELRKLNSTSVVISELRNYPVRCWTFDMCSSFDESVKEMVQVISQFCTHLQNNNTPFNMVIADCGARAIICPQRFGEKMAAGQIPEEMKETEVIPAVSEIAGHFISKHKSDYETLTQKKIFALLAEASLSEQQFSELTKNILSSLGMQ
eukprot:g6561.t1